MFKCDDYLSSGSDESLPPSPIYDRYHSGNRYHAVPSPYSGTFMPPKPDLVFNNAPIDVETVHTAFNVKLSPTKPDQDLSHTHRLSAPIIEDWVSDSEDESETKTPQNVSSFVQSTEQVKSPRTSVQHVETSIPPAASKTVILKPTSNGKRRNRKACFMCKSLDHLIKDCDYHDQKMAQTPPRNHSQRGIHKHYARMPLSSPQRHVFPTTVVPKSKLVPINAARPITAAVPKIKVTRPRHDTPIVTKTNSPPRRQINRGPSPKASNSPPRVTAVKAPMVNAAKVVQGKWEWKPKCPILDHVSCNTSASMTLKRNLSAKFEDFSDNNINEVNAAGTLVPTVGKISPNSTNTFSDAGPSNAAASPTHEKYSCIDTSQLPDDPNKPELEYITYSDNEDNVGTEADFNNLETSITVNPIPTTRVHKDHHVTQIIGDLSSAIQTMKEPKRVHQALKDPSWIEAMQEKLLKFKMQKVWVLVDLPHVKRAIDGKSAGTPIDTEKPLLKDPDGEDVDVHTYRSMIGSLMYLTSSRPEIMHAVCTCARFYVTPKASHLHAIKRIFRYLKGKPHLGLWYPKDSPVDLVAYSDIDYAGASLDRKSTTEGCQFLRCRLIYWQCKKQTVVATSSTEAEYVAAAICVNTPRSDEDMLELMELMVFLLPSDEKVGVEVSAVDLQVSAVRLILLLLVQKFLLFGLTNWCCSLNAVSEGFNQIIDFLNRSSIKYALTVNPNIYVSCIKQFWTSVAVKKVNDVTRLQALVDKKKVVITEASIRDALRLDDAEGIEYLPNEEIFAELARMGYEKPSTKLTFYKAFSQASGSRNFNFSKYIFDSLVRNVDSPTKFCMYPCFLQLMIRKQVGDLFSHSTKYTPPTMTQKVFANMRQVGKGFFKVETPLFEGMIVDQEVDEGDAEVNVDDVPAVGVAVEGDVSAANDEVLTAVEEPSIPSPTPQPSQDVPLTSQDKISQALEITKLKLRVKKLERRNKASKLKRLKKGGIIANINADEDVVLEDDKDVVVEKSADVKDNADIHGRKAESQAEIYKIDLEHAKKVLNMQEEESEPVEVQEVVDVVSTAKIINEVVTAASDTITAAITTITATDVPIHAATTAAAPTLTAAPSRRRKGVVIRDPEETTTTSTIIHSEAKSKDKGKGILKKQKEDKAMKRYQALKRKPQTKAQARKNMMIYFRNVAGFKMDYFKGMTYDDIRPIFKKHFDSNVAFLRKTKEHIDEVDSRALKRLNESKEDKAAKKQKLDEEVEELKRHLQIVPNDDDDVYTEATPLARKVPVVDYEIYNENNKPYFKIKRADEKRYTLTRFTLNQMLSNVQLEVEEESKVSLELLRFIRQQPQEGAQLE
nr:hypothetical protein [Tanacetum cinerariifolium]